MDGLSTLSISGWTQPSDALSAIAPNADVMDYAHAKGVAAVADLLPARSYHLVIGWSLGGLIARQLIATGKLQAKALVLIASPYQFVKSATMPHAMPTDVFEQFYTNYRDDTARTITRFKGLVATGDSREKTVLSQLQLHHQADDAAVWLPWLDVLKNYSAAQQNYHALPPTLIIHGQQDQIVRFEQAEALQRAIPSSQLAALPDSAHAPHIHEIETVKSLIRDFYRKAV